MAKTDHCVLPDGTKVPILYEDRGVLALDKPAGWMLGPEDEEHERRNLHLALTEGIEEGAWWARCRGLRFLRFVHRLDAPTTGILLFVKSKGAIHPFSDLFSSRAVEKVYLAVTDGVPKEERWRCRLPLGPEPDEPGAHRVDETGGKEAETEFQRLEVRGPRSLVEAHPYTGRTHQIRLHLHAAGCPVVGDILYGHSDPAGLALRAVGLTYRDPFTGRLVKITAPRTAFLERFGFGPNQKPKAGASVTVPVPGLVPMATLTTLIPPQPQQPAVVVSPRPAIRGRPVFHPRPTSAPPRPPSPRLHSDAPPRVVPPRVPAGPKTGSTTAASTPSKPGPKRHRKGQRPGQGKGKGRRS